MDDQFEPAAFLLDGKDHVFADQVLRDRGHVEFVGITICGEVDELHVVLVGQRFGDLLFVTEPQFDHRLTQAFA